MRKTDFPKQFNIKYITFFHQWCLDVIVMWNVELKNCHIKHTYFILVGSGIH